MPDKPTVIFLDYFENLQKVAPLLKKICARSNKAVVVSSNYDTTPLTKYLGVKIVYFDELLTRQDYQFMDTYISNLMPSWYLGLKSMEGITKYNSIQFGEIAEERAQRFFSSAIKRLEIVLKIRESFYPQRIILIGEKGVFQELSIFIKEELNIPTLFIKAGEEKNILREIIRYFRAFLTEIICYLCDKFMQRFIIRKKIENGILIDSHLYFELKDLRKIYYPYLYLIEKGLRIRLRLIKDQKLPYVPVLAEGFLKLPAIFSSFFRYWEVLRKDIEFQNKFNYKNLPIWKLLKKAIRELIIDDFSYAKKNVVFLKNLFQTLKPGLVILREDARAPERTVALTAKAASIPTLVIQHGILAGRGVHAKLISDTIALWGKAGIDWFARDGNSNSRYIVTGRPAHDSIYLNKNNYKKEREELFLKIGLNPDKETILYVPGDFKKQRPLFCVYYFHDAEYTALNSVLNVARYFPQKQWIIKIHPFDAVDTNSLFNYIKDYPNVFVVRNVDIKVLIEGSSLVIISFFSSTGLDAVILNRPMITFNLYKSDDLVPFAQRGIALNVTRPEQLYQTVRQVFEDKKLIEWFDSNRDAFIYDYAYKIDGKSTERVLSLVKGLYNEHLTNQSSV